MLWTALSMQDLYGLIERRSPGLLDRLGSLLPLVGDDIRGLDSREVLATIAESFLPSDLFQDIGVRRQLLMILPPERLRRLAATVSATIHQDAAFSAQVEELIALPYGVLVDALVELGEISARFKTVEKTPVPGSVLIQPASEENPVTIVRPFRQLLDYQHFIFSRCASELEPQLSRVILQMPTGAGKTRTAMEIVCSKMNNHSNAIVVWLAHTEELCDQAFDSFLDVSTHLTRKPVNVIRNWAGLHKAAIPEGNAFVVTTYQTLCQGGGGLKDVDKNRIALIVADEAHVATAPRYKEAILSYLGGRTSILGLTATPIRRDERESEELRTFFFDSIVSSSDEERFSAKRLQSRKILAKPTFVISESHGNIELNRGDAQHLEDERDLGKKILVKLSEETSRNALIARHCVDLARRGKSVLLFACSVEHSKFLASLLLTCGVKAAHVDGGTDRNYRRAAIESFRRGEISVLCNFGVLTTGFDAPNTDAVLLARPTLSPVLYSQMVGRAMRGPAMGGKAETTIIDIRDNFLMFGRPLELFESFRELWRQELS
jgi:DNA repair protein RadD